MPRSNCNKDTSASFSSKPLEETKATGKTLTQTEEAAAPLAGIFSLPEKGDSCALVYDGASPTVARGGAGGWGGWHPQLGRVAKTLHPLTLCPRDGCENRCVELVIKGKVRMVVGEGVGCFGGDVILSRPRRSNVA